MARRRSAPAPRRAAPARQTAPAPAPAPTQMQTQPQPTMVQKAPGFLSSVASTALGVAGGHVIADTIMGGRSSHEAQPQQQQQQVQQPQQQQMGSQYQQNPCGMEMENFFNCTQQQYDLSMCEGLNEALKQCRMRYSNPSM